MIYGLTSRNERVSAKQANRGTEYYCPGCNAKLILKQGEIRIWHFAHSTGINCDAFTENKMTEWHLAHQMEFPEECREIRLEKNGVVHIADIKDNNLIVEFQHSPIDNETFEERTQFYSQFGHLVWIFDCVDKWETEAIRCIEDPKTHQRWFEWDHASKVLGKYDIKRSGFDLFIELDRSGWGCLVEWNPIGMKRFSGRLFNKSELHQYLKNVKKGSYGLGKYWPPPEKRSKPIIENEKIIQEREEQKRREEWQKAHEKEVASAKAQLNLLYPMRDKLINEEQEARAAWDLVREKLNETVVQISRAEAILL